MTPSQRQERMAARRHAGSVTPGSGNQWIFKGDVRTPTELVECKTTSHNSYTLKLVDLKTIEVHALSDGRRPIFEIEFQGQGSYVVLPASDYHELRNSAS